MVERIEARKLGERVGYADALLGRKSEIAWACADEGTLWSRAYGSGYREGWQRGVAQHTAGGLSRAQATQSPAR